MSINIVTAKAHWLMPANILMLLHAATYTFLHSVFLTRVYVRFWGELASRFFSSPFFSLYPCEVVSIIVSCLFLSLYRRCVLAHCRMFENVAFLSIGVVFQLSSFFFLFLFPK